VVSPSEIVDAAHELCVEDLMPNGVSPPHEADRHNLSGELYAAAINEAGVETTGPEVIESILGVTGWDKRSPWPSHPHPDKVIEWITSRSR